MYDHRFWGPKGAYGPPLRHDWYYHCSDIPCHAHVPWEGCPYPPDVCHDPKYAYPPPLPVMGPIPPMPKDKKGCDCGCECSCNNENENTTVDNPDNTGYVDGVTDTNTTYTLSRSGDNIVLTGSDGNTYTVQDRDTNTNTTYTLTKNGNYYVLNGSDGTHTQVEGGTLTVENGSITEAKLAQEVVNKLNATASGNGVTYTIERTDDYIRLKGSDGSESSFRDVILSAWIGQKQVFWVHLADSLKQYIMGQGVYTYVDGQTFDTNHTPLIALNKANERKNLKVYTPSAYDSDMGINFYECVTGETGWQVNQSGFDNRPIVETKTVNGKRFFKIRIYAGYVDKDNSCGVANVLMNLAYLPAGTPNEPTRVAGDSNMTFTYHNTGIVQGNKGLFAVKATVKKEYAKMNNTDVNFIDIEFCEDDVTPVVWHENAYNDGELTAIPADAFTNNGTTFVGLNLDMIMTSVYRQNLSIVSITVERVN